MTILLNFVALLCVAICAVILFVFGKPKKKSLPASPAGTPPAPAPPPTQQVKWGHRLKQAGWVALWVFGVAILLAFGGTLIAFFINDRSEWGVVKDFAVSQWKFIVIAIVAGSFLLAAVTKTPWACRLWEGIKGLAITAALFFLIFAGTRWFFKKADAITYRPVIYDSSRSEVEEVTIAPITLTAPVNGNPTNPISGNWSSPVTRNKGEEIRWKAEDSGLKQKILVQDKRGRIRPFVGFRSPHEAENSFRFSSLADTSAVVTIIKRR